MDLALLSTLIPATCSGVKRVLMSYDIGCQWWKNLEKHIAFYPMSSSLKLKSLEYWNVVVPKFHLAGHRKDCQLLYNINFTKGAAMMSGEMIESGWAQSGSMAVWTRENGPFARRGVLDDHWGSENWRKLRRLRKSIRAFQSQRLCLPFLLGVSLLKNLRKALTWSKTQHANADKASQGLPATTLTDWTNMRNEFDRDRKKPNPYEEPETCKLLRSLSTHSILILTLTVVTVASLRRKFNNNNARKLRRGHVPPHIISPSSFLGSALQIEEQQYVPCHVTPISNH